jgi:site-specific recombinase XerD
MNNIFQGSPLQKLITRIDGAYAPSTLRAYRSDFEEFIAFCGHAGTSALPAQPETVAEFIDSVCQSGASSASIRRKLVAIASIHRLSRYPDPTKDGDVHLAMRKMHRKLGRMCDQAYGITAPLLDRLIVATSDDLHGLRDRALLHIAYETMRRRSELVSLRVEDLVESPNGATLLLRRSKTDQEGKGTRLYISLTALACVKDWLASARIEHGFILRGVVGNKEVTDSLSGDRIGRIYKRLARTAGIAATTVAQISGHSLRVGAAQDLLKGGATLPQIMVKGGWVKVDTVMRYVENTSFDSTGIIFA